jgi:hypothetical protein
VVVAGGLAALGAYLLNRQRNTAAGNGRGPW